jgi:TolA-binding protein
LLLARNALANIQFEEARRILAALIAAPPKHDRSAAPRAQWLLGESYFLARDYRQAIAAYTAAVDASAAPAWTEVALMQRAKCYELLGDFAAAAADYRRVVQEFRASSFAATASSRLSDIDSHVRSANASTIPATQLK